MPKTSILGIFTQKWNLVGYFWILMYSRTALCGLTPVHRCLALGQLERLHTGFILEKAFSHSSWWSSDRIWSGLSSQHAWLLTAGFQAIFWICVGSGRIQSGVTKTSDYKQAGNVVCRAMPNHLYFQFLGQNYLFYMGGNWKTLLIFILESK